jgi:hypothetical protein
MDEILNPEPEIKTNFEKMEEEIETLPPMTRIGITKACHTKSKRYLKMQDKSRKINRKRRK